MVFWLWNWVDYTQSLGSCQLPIVGEGMVETASTGLSVIIGPGVVLRGFIKLRRTAAKIPSGKITPPRTPIKT